MLPSKCQQFFYVASNQLLFRILPQGLQLGWLDDHQYTDLGTFPLNEEGVAACRRVLTSNDSIKQAERRLVLTPTQYISRHVSLPAEASSNLLQVLAYEMDRFTPFRSEQVFYDAVYVDDSQPGEPINVQLAVVPKKTLQTLLNDLLSCGIKPAKVCFSSQLNQQIDGAAFNLLPEKLRPAVDKKKLYLNVGLGIIFYLLVATIFAYPSWYAKSNIAQLEQKISALELEAQAAGKMRSEIRQYQTQVNVLLEKPNYKRRVIDVVKEMSVRLPANTWLNQLRIASNNVQINGFSADPTSIIRLIDGSPLFENTRFTSPLATNRNAQQSFKISSVMVQEK